MPGVSTEEMDRHVNEHLDNDEQHESLELASTLMALESSAEPFLAEDTVQRADLRQSLEVEKPCLLGSGSRDAPMAEGLEQTIAGVGLKTSLVHVDGTLRGGLANSAENVLVDFGSRLAKCYSISNALEFHRVHISSYFDLYTTSVSGVGFDCGFRNAAIMMSCLLRDREICAKLAESGVFDVPVILEMQSRIEEAWNKHGFDPQGAAHYEHRLVDRDVWIGACEIVVLLRSVGLRAQVADFELSGVSSTQAMLRWVYNYFDQRCRHPASGASAQGCLRCRNPYFGRRGSLIPPLFLQHQGHSRSIVGVEMTRGGAIRLLVVDPVRSFAAELARWERAGKSILPLVRVEEKDLDMRQYQIVFVPEGPIIQSEAELAELKTIVNAIGPYGSTGRESSLGFSSPPS
jgi:Peptidase family C78